MSILFKHNINWRYAIGEVVLIFIGITLAIAFDTWNDDRNRKAELESIYVSIADELQRDIARLDQILPNFNWKIQVMGRIINQEYTKEDWITNDSLFASFFSFYDFDIGQERFQLLKSKVAVDNPTRTLNNQIADFYKKHLTDVPVRTEEANMSYHRNIAHWENEEWFSSAIVDQHYSLLSNYAHTDFTFRNKITWYRIMLLRLENALKRYRDDAQELSRQINNQYPNEKNK